MQNHLELKKDHWLPVNEVNGIIKFEKFGGQISICVGDKD